MYVCDEVMRARRYTAFLAVCQVIHTFYILHYYSNYYRLYSNIRIVRTLCASRIAYCHASIYLHADRSQYYSIRIGFLFEYLYVHVQYFCIPLVPFEW